MPDDPRYADEKEQVPTNLRLLMLLEEVVAAAGPVTPTKANAGLGLPKPTLHRLFHTLEAEGFLQRDIDGRSYGPGPRLRRLSVHTLSAQRVRAARLVILRALADDIGETCNIAIPDRERMVYLDRVETKWPLRIQLPIGSTVPFHATASGKMYLSSLKERALERILTSIALPPNTDRTLTDADALRREVEAIRTRGYSTDDEEFMEGMTAIAVPILDDMGRLVSTLSVHGPIQRNTVSDLIQHLPKLRNAGRELAATLME
ncbi:MAG: IclR family transcriptional regulator [Pseudomonadota bacterium]